MKTSKRLQLISFLLIGATFVLTFQNCSPTLELASLPSSSQLDGADRLRFEKALQIVNSRCVSCHTTGGSAAFAPFNFSEQSQFVASGMIVPGSPNSSKLIYRLRRHQDTQVPNRNMPPAGDLTEQEYNDLSAWVSMMSTSADAFTCEPNKPLHERAVAKSMKRLTRRQYLNTLNDLLSRGLSVSVARQVVDSSVASVSLPTDDKSSFSRFDSSVIRQHMKAYFDVSDSIATQVTTDPNYTGFVTGFVNLDRGSCTALNVASLSSACASRFISNFASRALRRPLIASSDVNELNDYTATYTQAGGGRAGINAVVFRVLLAPNFIYQIENGGTARGASVYHLSSHEVANRLSYMFWNSMPDEQLLQMATTRDFSDNLAFAPALDYVADHDRAQDSIREFMHEWLKLEEVPRFATNNQSLQYLAGNLVLNDSVRSAMIDEVEELGSYVFRNGLGFTDLFMTDVSFARNSTLMNIYGVTQAAPANVTPANAVRFPAGERNGLLTRGALLVGGSELANPIKRGIKVRKQILCLDIEAPPAELGEALEPPAVNENLTTRERYDHATSAQVCMNCHQYINTLGHALGSFNSFGKFELREPTFNASGSFSGRQLPINSHVDLSTSLAPGLTAANARDFSSLVASQKSAHVCFSENYLRFAEGRLENESKEGCRLNGLYNHLNKSHSLKEFMKSMASDAEFRHRLIPQN